MLFVIITSMSEHSRMIRVITYTDLYIYLACALSVFLLVHQPDKFVITSPLPTKRVAVDSHDIADSDSVCASELEEEQPPPSMMAVSVSRSAAAVSMMSKAYKS